MRDSLGRLNGASKPATVEMLLRCCGSRAWAVAMAASRPFRSLAHAIETSDHIWTRLPPSEWEAAFAAHPRIGEKREGWSAHEQSGALTAAAKVRDDLAAANAEYERRFGRLFIICATGKSADQMLAALNARLALDPQAELRAAAGEQRQITRLRLEKLLA